MYQKTEKYQNNQEGNYYNVGWIINGDSFPTGTINEATLTKLFLLLARERINAMRSFEYCTLATCNGQEVMHYHELAHLTGTYNPETGAHQTLNQEIWLSSADGTKIFVAPSIILHYITDHNYLPPQEFLDAVDHFDFAGTWSGTEAREACLKQIYEEDQNAGGTEWQNTTNGNITQHKTFRFSENFNGTGFYAKVAIRVEESSAPDYSFEINEWVDTEWHTSIRFALDYFFRHYRKSLKVTIEELHTMIIDSSEITVVYAIVKCLSDLLGFNKELIKFNNGCFEFAK